ncbi:uncharacterized protein LOC121974643 isoform X4 [Zingiber officinale]|uniref:uncharacterized protein LOC121974643 isoform X4 n=1 Tax=Zingiber officinale TaxID=94328 RepID=UPI001C4B7C16|nr:uncharacterized protein LOC121974643 isoform X4 [Zingiber officinale]
MPWWISWRSNLRELAPRRSSSSRSPPIGAHGGGQAWVQGSISEGGGQGGDEAQGGLSSEAAFVSSDEQIPRRPRNRTGGCRQKFWEHIKANQLQASSDGNAGFMIDMLKECGLSHKSIIFVLDKFDLFAQVRVVILATNRILCKYFFTCLCSLVNPPLLFHFYFIMQWPLPYSKSLIFLIHEYAGETTFTL